MKTEITKGEWEAYQTDVKPDRWMICAGPTGEQGIVKTVLDNSISPAEKKANIQLISSAPDLYEACRVVAESLKDRLGMDAQNEILVLKKVLAKAEGK